MKKMKMQLKLIIIGIIVIAFFIGGLFIAKMFEMEIEELQAPKTDDALKQEEPKNEIPASIEDIELLPVGEDISQRGFGGGGGGGGGGSKSSSSSSSKEESVSLPACAVSASYGVNEHGTSINVDDEVFVVISNNNNYAQNGAIVVDGANEANAQINAFGSFQQLSQVMTSWLQGLQGSGSRTFTVQFIGDCSAQTSAALSYTENGPVLD